MVVQSHLPSAACQHACGVGAGCEGTQPARTLTLDASTARASLVGRKTVPTHSGSARLRASPELRSMPARLDSSGRAWIASATLAYGAAATEPGDWIDQAWVGRGQGLLAACRQALEHRAHVRTACACRALHGGGVLRPHSSLGRSPSSAASARRGSMFERPHIWVVVVVVVVVGGPVSSAGRPGQSGRAAARVQLSDLRAAHARWARRPCDRCCCKRADKQPWPAFRPCRTLGARVLTESGARATNRLSGWKWASLEDL